MSRRLFYRISAQFESFKNLEFSPFQADSRDFHACTKRKKILGQQSNSNTAFCAQEPSNSLPLLVKAFLQNLLELPYRGVFEHFFQYESCR